ncbi:MAG: rhodanese-like domain-containing protein [Hylemonella sp.]|jgi:rhodanese-related sulfurtransferase
MIEQVHPGDLQNWMEKVRAFGQPIVLDVREPNELERASVKADGFELVHIPMGVIPPRLGELDPSRPVACLCHHGARSMRVAAFLEYQGFQHIANISGGINAWSNQLDPTVPRY